MGKVKCLYNTLPLDEYNAVEKKCKMCGKKYLKAWTKSGYSDFCSAKCSRQFSTAATRAAISKRVSAKLKGRLLGKNAKLLTCETVERHKEKYYQNPKKCIVCFGPIPFEKRHKCKTCCKACQNKLAAQNAKRLIAAGKLNKGGYFQKSSRGKSGYYNGVWCDSTYELAFLIYNMDLGLDVKRCRKAFIYEMDGIKRKYFPDFIVNGKIIEIKNYWRPEVDAKVSAVKKAGYDIFVLYQKDLEPMMDYIDRTYNLRHNGKRNNYHTLYDGKAGMV